jgi:hypothetical protein
MFGLRNKHISILLFKFTVCLSTFISITHGSLCYGLCSIFFGCLTAHLELQPYPRLNLWLMSDIRAGFIQVLWPFLANYYSMSHSFIYHPGMVQWVCDHAINDTSFELSLISIITTVAKTEVLGRTIHLFYSI